jgi:hypothetical protein
MKINEEVCILYYYIIILVIFQNKSLRNRFTMHCNLAFQITNTVDEMK